MLAVLVRAAGLYLLLTAALNLLAIVLAMTGGSVALLALAAPLVQLIIGVLVIQKADSIAAFCYRWDSPVASRRKSRQAVLAALARKVLA